MTNAIDPRLVRLSIEINGAIQSFENLAITAMGTKYSTAIFNECDITIFNLTKATQDYILSMTSPFNPDQTPKLAILEAGRQSYGYSRVFTGNIIASSTSEPPDIGVSLKCITGYYQNGSIVARSAPPLTKMSVIAQQLAGDMKLALNFQATDKQIANFSYTGSLTGQVNELCNMGLIDAFIDDTTLIVKDRDKALVGRVKVIDVNSGMIGIPEIDQYGLRVRYLLDNESVVGGAIEVISQIYPAVNGIYNIFKLDFEISNRDTPFYYIASTRRPLKLIQ